MAEKRDYQKWVWQYKRRREAYKNQIRKVTKKISQWNNEIKRIEATTERISRIENAVNYFFSVEISSKKMDKDHKLARSIYYKIAIESKIQGNKVAEHIGRSKKMATDGRLSFTRTFNSEPKNKEQYHRFKKYFEENKSN